MSSSSSISNSRRAASHDRQAPRFGVRLAKFVAPILLLGFIGGAIVLISGELLPVNIVARLQSYGRPFIYLAKFSDYTYRLKIEATIIKKPEILVMGASRSNQWRSAMFRPAVFYNAGNCLYTQRDYRRMLEDIGDSAPRVIIFSVDFYTFNNDWDPTFGMVAYGELSGWGSEEQKKILRDFVDQARSEPQSLIRVPIDPVYGVPALGLMASSAGIGTRLDGSYQYGARILGKQGVSLESAIERTVIGRKPFQFGARIDQSQRDEFERFVKLARSRGITLIGVTMPFAPPVVDALNRSPKHAIWREFQTPEFGEWIERQGVTYFNFTNLESFGGRPQEFVDPFHPSEPAYIRMLLTMLASSKVRAIFPEIDTNALRKRLAESSDFESYRNDF
jgi:hypothetical protein